MWIVAGTLLGLVLLCTLVGFHAGPHGHVAAAALGILAAVWLVVMAATGHGAPLLWTLLSADVVASAGIGTAAYKGLAAEHELANRPARTGLVGAEGVALSELDPDGVVHVNGEEWSARSLNGHVAKGGAVQVVSDKGIRLEVWGEAALHVGNDAEVKFTLDDLLEEETALLTDAEPAVLEAPSDPAEPPPEKKASAS